jgi:glycerophosphoryl diester phosphodiesterase
MKSNANKPLIIAHRGASALAPENTLAAFQKAIEDGADGIEFDVRISKDGVPVVFHDSTLKRIVGQEVSVSNLLCEQLQTFDVGSWFNLKNQKKAKDIFAAETIPTFVQLLDFLKDYKGLLYVELKGIDGEIPALAESVCDLIGRSHLFPQVIIKSFNLEGIRITKNILPDVRTAALFEPKIPASFFTKRSLLIDKAAEFKADELSLHYSLATKKLVREAKDRGLTTVIWTVERKVWIKLALNLDIKAIITNNPASLLAKRRAILGEDLISA